MKRVFYLSILAISFIFLNSNPSFSQKSEYSFVKELDNLVRPDLLPAYRTGEYVEQISSYDRTGKNDDGFGGAYSFIRKEGNHLVIADFKGAGVVNRIWTPTPTDDTLAFYFDGEKKSEDEDSVLRSFFRKCISICKGYFWE